MASTQSNNQNSSNIQNQTQTGNVPQNMKPIVPTVLDSVKTIYIDNSFLQENPIAIYSTIDTFLKQISTGLNSGQTKINIPFRIGGTIKVDESLTYVSSQRNNQPNSNIFTFPTTDDIQKQKTDSFNRFYPTDIASILLDIKSFIENIKAFQGSSASKIDDGSFTANILDLAQAKDENGEIIGYSEVTVAKKTQDLQNQAIVLQKELASILAAAKGGAEPKISSTFNQDIASQISTSSLLSKWKNIIQPLFEAFDRTPLRSETSDASPTYIEWNQSDNTIIRYPLKEVKSFLNQYLIDVTQNLGAGKGSDAKLKRIYEYITNEETNSQFLEDNGHWELLKQLQVGLDKNIHFATHSQSGDKSTRSITFNPYPQGKVIFSESVPKEASDTDKIKNLLELLETTSKLIAISFKPISKAKQENEEDPESSGDDDLLGDSETQLVAQITLENAAKKTAIENATQMLFSELKIESLVQQWATSWETDTPNSDLNFNQIWDFLLEKIHLYTDDVFYENPEIKTLRLPDSDSNRNKKASIFSFYDPETNLYMLNSKPYVDWVETSIKEISIAAAQKIIENFNNLMEEFAVHQIGYKPSQTQQDNTDQKPDETTSGVPDAATMQTLLDDLRRDPSLQIDQNVTTEQLKALYTQNPEQFNDLINQRLQRQLESVTLLYLKSQGFDGTTLDSLPSEIRQEVLRDITFYLRSIPTDKKLALFSSDAMSQKTIWLQLSSEYNRRLVLQQQPVSPKITNYLATTLFEKHIKTATKLEDILGKNNVAQLNQAKQQLHALLIVNGYQPGDQFLLSNSITPERLAVMLGLNPDTVVSLTPEQFQKLKQTLTNYLDQYYYQQILDKDSWYLKVYRKKLIEQGFTEDEADQKIQEIIGSRKVVPTGLLKQKIQPEDFDKKDGPNIEKFGRLLYIAGEEMGPSRYEMAREAYEAAQKAGATELISEYAVFNPEEIDSYENFEAWMFTIQRENNLSTIDRLKAQISWEEYQAYVSNKAQSDALEKSLSRGIKQNKQPQNQKGKAKEEKGFLEKTKDLLRKSKVIKNIATVITSAVAAAKALFLGLLALLKTAAIVVSGALTAAFFGLAAATSLATAALVFGGAAAVGGGFLLYKLSPGFKGFIDGVFGTIANTGKGIADFVAGGVNQVASAVSSSIGNFIAVTTIPVALIGGSILTNQIDDASFLMPTYVGDTAEISRFIDIKKTANVPKQLNNPFSGPITYRIEISVKDPSYDVVISNAKDTLTVTYADPDLTFTPVVRDQDNQEDFSTNIDFDFSQPHELTEPLEIIYIHDFDIPMEDVNINNTFELELTATPKAGGSAITETAITAEILCVGDCPQAAGDMCWPAAGRITQLPVQDPTPNNPNPSHNYVSRDRNTGEVLSVYRSDAFDISAAIGDPIYAPFNGTVLPQLPMPPRIEGRPWPVGTAFGPHHILIRNDANQVVYAFAHNSASFVVPNQKVRKGDLIGEIGDLGYSFGPHLHFDRETPRGGFNGLTANDPQELFSEMPADVNGNPVTVNSFVRPFCN